MSHYDILRAIKTGYAPNHYTAVYAKCMGGAKEYERYISGQPPLILSDSVGKPLVSWSITGNTVQDGESTPTAPIEVKGTGERTKNLFNPSMTRYEYAYTNKVIDYPGGAMFFLKAETGKYTFKVNDNIPVVRFGCTDEPYTTGVVLQNLVEYPNGYTKDTEITIDNNCTYLVLQVAGSYANTHDLSAIQIEYGDTATEYEPYGYKIPVVNRGENLFDASTQKYVSKSEYGLTWQVNSDNTITVSGKASGYTVFMLADRYRIPSKYRGQKVTFNFNIFNNANNIVWSEIIFYDDDNKNVGTYAQGISSKFTIELQDNFAKFTAVVKRNNNVATSGTIGLMLNLGNTATEYEPYIEPKTSTIYLNSPLMADEVLRSDGTREVEWGKLVLTGDEECNSDTAAGLIRFGFPYSYYTSNHKIGYCSHYRYEYANRDFNIAHSSDSNSLLYILDSRFSNVYSFKQWLKSEYDAGHPVTVWYELATPTTETVDVPTFPTFKGSTVLDVDTQIQPTNMSVTYKSRR